MGGTPRFLLMLVSLSSVLFSFPALSPYPVPRCLVWVWRRCPQFGTGRTALLSQPHSDTSYSTTTSTHNTGKHSCNGEIWSPRCCSIVMVLLCCHGAAQLPRCCSVATVLLSCHGAAQLSWCCSVATVLLSCHGAALLPRCCSVAMVLVAMVLLSCYGVVMFPWCCSVAMVIFS